MTAQPRRIDAAFSRQQTLIASAFAQQQANRTSLLRREQSSRTIARGVKAATTASTATTTSA